MQKILLLNQDWFSKELKQEGFDVITVGSSYASHLDHTIESAFIHIDQVIEQLPKKNWIPDVIIALDNSSPLIFTGIEDTKIPTIFYSVDTHHHFGLHRYLSHVFDHTLIAQKDYSDFFKEEGIETEWFPLWASRYVDSCEEKKFGCVFVGTLNKKLNPERVKFFEELQTKTNLLCQTGAFWEIFPFSHIVINQTVKLDLNFRVFEAMMCGPLLLTEKSGNGLLELFEDGKHLVTYKKNDVEDARSKIDFYLNNLDLTKEIARCGREEILKNHTASARAKKLIDIIKNVRKKKKDRRYLSMAVNYLCLSKSSGNVEDNVRLVGLTHSLRCYELALEEKQTFDETSAVHLVITALGFDRITRGNKGYLLIKKYFNFYPHSQVLLLSVIRGAMNNGELDYAKNLCLENNFEDCNQAYNHADQVIRSLVNLM